MFDLEGLLFKKYLGLQWPQCIFLFVMMIAVAIVVAMLVFLPKNAFTAFY
jgi:hypothetical protein